MILILSDELFQFETLTALADWASQRQAIASVVSDLDEYFFDARIVAEKCQVVLLRKAAIETYLQALKQCKITLKMISPLSMPAFNLVDWRAQQRQSQCRKRVLRLGGLPAVAFLSMMAVIYVEDSTLQAEKTTNHALNQALHRLNAPQPGLAIQPVITLLEGLELTQNIDSLNINQQGEVNITGTALDTATANKLLEQISKLPGLQANSMHNWTLYDEHLPESWSVAFLLKE